MNKTLRHGEIILHPVSAFPKGRKKQVTSYIVGHSETGHHHVLESTDTFKVLKTAEDSVWLEILSPANLVHKKQVDKHNTLTVSPGKYKVIYKTEYDPWSKVIKRVED